MNDDWMNGIGKKAGCHTGNPLVFEVDGIKVFAGGHSRNGGWHRMSPRPALALGPAQVMDDSRTVVPTGFSCAQHIGGGTHIISIDWPDFSIPQDVSRDFWVALVDDIRNQGITTVSTQCVGGHGRTGVQLCILGHLLGDEACLAQPDAAALIKHVRDIYCTHAVETDSQQLYIANTLGIPVGDSLFAKAKSKHTNYFTDAIVEEDNFTRYAGLDLGGIEVEDDKKKTTQDGYDFFACEFCDHSEWVKVGDDAPVCPNHKDAPMTYAGEALNWMDETCYICHSPTSPFGLINGGACKVCDAEKKGVKTRKGEIQCKKCKRYHAPEFIGADGVCGACTYKKKNGKKKNGKKNGKKKGGKKQDRLPVPDGGLDNESLLAYIENYKR